MQLGVVNAMKSAKQTSLAVLLKALVGEKRREVQPVLATTLVIDANQRIELHPTVLVTLMSFRSHCQAFRTLY